MTFFGYDHLASESAPKDAKMHRRRAIRFGSRSATGMKGFANSDCAVMIVHGEQDDTIPISYGYGTYYKKYADDARFTFKKYPDRDHGVMTLEDGSLDLELMAEIVAFFDAQISD